MSQIKSDFLSDMEHVASDAMYRVQNRLTISNPRIAERYREGYLRVELLVHSLVDDIYYLADLRRSFEVNNTDDAAIPTKVEGGITWLERPANERRPTGFDKQLVYDSRKLPVFVNVVQVVEHPEQFIPSAIRIFFVASPRLVLLNPSEDIRRNAPYFSFGLGDHVLLSRLIDGEADVLAGHLGLGVVTGQFTEQMVEAATQAEEDFPDDQWHLRRNRRSARQAIRYLMALDINIGANHIWVRVPESLTDLIKIDDVLFGPFEL